MADVITRFKLETTQFDSKLRDTSKALRDIAHQAELGGKDFDKFSDEAIKSARALGTVQSGATNTKDKLKDLVGSYNDAAKAYNSLTDAAKKGEFGKAMSQSLTQLQQRIKETKQEIYSLGDSMTGGGGLFGGGKLDGMLQVFGGNVMTKIAGAGLSFVSELKDMVTQGIELSRAGEGIRIAFERLGRGDILDGLREATHGTVTDLELMKAAVKFNDFKLPLDELGTMLAFAQQKAKDTGQSVDYMVDSIVTGLGRKSLMILDNLGLSAAEVKEKMAETGDMTKAVGAIIREQMSKAGDYVETAADRAAQANVSLQNKMEELGRKFAPIEEASNQLWTSMKIGILDVVGGPLAKMLNSLTEAGRLMNALSGNNGEQGSGNTKVDQQLNKLRGSNYKQFYYNKVVENYTKQINDLQAQINNGGKKPGAGSGTSQDVRYLTAQKQSLEVMLGLFRSGAKDIMQPVKVDIKTDEAIKGVGDLTKKLKELEAQRKKAVLAGDNELVDTLTKQINQVKQNIGYLDPNALKTTSGKTTAQKISFDPNKALLSAEHITDTMPSIWSMIMENGKTAGIGDQGLRNMLGIDKQQFDIGRVLKEYVSDPDKEKRDKANKADKGDKDLAKNISTLTSGITSLTSGIKGLGIDLPKEVDDVIGIITSLTSIIQGVQTIISIFGNTAMAANTAAIIANTAALTANTATNLLPFAHGGIVPHAANGYYVPGTHASGDVTPIMANAGELVLNKSSQNNLANELKGAEALVQTLDRYQTSIMRGSQIGSDAVSMGAGILGNLRLSAEVSAEQIYFILKNNGMRTGRGEFVTTNFR